MSRATMVFADKNGALDFSLVFDDGFDPKSPAHQHAQIVLKMLDEIMGEKTQEEVVPLQQEEPRIQLVGRA